MMDIKEFLLLRFINFFDKELASLEDKSTIGSSVAAIQNEQLAEELHKPIIKKLKKQECILYLTTIFGVLI